MAKTLAKVAKLEQYKNAVVIVDFNDKEDLVDSNADNDDEADMVKRIPDELIQFKPIIEKNKLIISYDKNKTSLKNIIDILNKNNFYFNEINTYESDLEDIFLKLIKS